MVLAVTCAVALSSGSLSLKWILDCCNIFAISPVLNMQRTAQKLYRFFSTRFPECGICATMTEHKQVPGFMGWELMVRLDAPLPTQRRENDVHLIQLCR